MHNDYYLATPISLAERIEVILTDHVGQGQDTCLPI